MIPFVLAVFVTTAVSPIVDWLVVGVRFPGWLAISIALILVLAILLLLGAELTLTVQTILSTAEEYTKQVTDLTRKLFGELHEHGLKVDENAVTDQIKSWLPGLITTAAGTVTSVVADGVLISFFVIFLLAGR